MSDEGRERKPEEENGGTSSWMVTFSDLSTLLLTFFVLLISMSSMDDKKLKSLFSNFTSSCGILLFKEYGEIYRPKDLLIQGLYQKLKDTLVVRKMDDAPDDLVAQQDDDHSETLGSSLKVEDLSDGFKLVFGKQLLFAPGSAEIRPEMEPIIEEIGRFLSRTYYQVYIEGHTDNVPIHSAAYASNESLSLARAFNIMDYLARKMEVSPANLALAGYGESKPLAPNDTAEGRGENRRVEIIFKNQKYF